MIESLDVILWDKRSARLSPIGKDTAAKPVSTSTAIMSATAMTSPRSVRR